MAYYRPPTTDPDTSARWRRSPDPHLHRYRDSSNPKHPYPSSYYPDYYYPPFPNESSQKTYNQYVPYGPPPGPISTSGSSTYPRSYPPQPPLGPPFSLQPYWQQPTGPHSSLTPYQMQPPGQSADYPAVIPSPPIPPISPPPSTFPNYPAHHPHPYQQQPVLTLYINPAFLTPTPYNHPVSPPLEHYPPYNDVDQPSRRSHSNRENKRVRFQQGTRNVPSPYVPYPYAYPPGTQPHVPPDQRPLSLQGPSSPVAPVTGSSPSPSPPPPRRASMSPRLPTLSPTSRTSRTRSPLPIPALPSPTRLSPQRPPSPSYIRSSPIVVARSRPRPVAPPTIPPHYSESSATYPTESKTDAWTRPPTHRTQPRSPESLPFRSLRKLTQGTAATRTVELVSTSAENVSDAPATQIEGKAVLESSIPESPHAAYLSPPPSRLHSARSSRSGRPPRSRPLPAPPSVRRRTLTQIPFSRSQEQTITEVSIEEPNLDTKSIEQVVSKDKLEQALENGDPRLEALQEIIDFPKLLELLSLKAGSESGEQPYENAAASENDAEQVSETGCHSEDALDETVRNDVQIEDEVRSNSETSVEHLVPEIPPSPLGYSIDLVYSDKEYDVGDDTVPDPELADEHSARASSRESENRNEAVVPRERSETPPSAVPSPTSPPRPPPRPPFPPREPTYERVIYYERR